MDQRPHAQPGERRVFSPSPDPVAENRPEMPSSDVLAGRDPGAMDAGVGAHDGTRQAGDPGYSTAERAGSDLETNWSEGVTAGGQGRAETPAAFPEASGGSDRPVQATDDPRSAVGDAMGNDVVALLDLPRWTEHLHALPSWREGDRASAMLLRQPPVRVLLTALRRDAEVGSDGAEETVMLLVIAGAASIEWRGEIARVGEGEVALVPRGGGWRFSSESDETVLLSTFWGTSGRGVADITEETTR